MRRLLPALLLAASLPVHAQEAEIVFRLPQVQVKGMRFELSSFDMPASVDVVGNDWQSGKPNVNLSEQLTGVAGVLARNRQNYAQDEQISIRGFGSRSTFGVRGLRLYADGIPASMPDGQGQVSHFSLTPAERIEIIRGPFSALYGNASGGVIQIWSADGTAPAQYRLQIGASNDDTQNIMANARGKSGMLDYNVTASHFTTEGTRAHSSAERNAANAKLNLRLSQRNKLSLVFNWMDTPKAQDPLGLTWIQYRQDPRQATSAALQFNTRKSIRQVQGGAILEHTLGDRGQLRLMAYSGRRDVEQVLSIPVAAQRNPLHSGGVVDLQSRYQGVDLRWTHKGEWIARPYELVVGTVLDRQDQRRRGYENFLGALLGVRGNLRRDELDQVRNWDQYAQLYWRFSRSWALLLGSRRSEVRFNVDDFYTPPGNPDDSGKKRYSETTALAGVQYRFGTQWRAYVSYGTGFETPTLTELSYRADGGAGLALFLRPAKSKNMEVGLKWRPSSQIEMDAAAFRSDTNNELAVATNASGRTTYQNAGPSRRQGFELSGLIQLGSVNLRAAFTHLLPKFLDSHCPSDGCGVMAGSQIPGIARNYGSLRLGRDTERGWSGSMQLDGVGKTKVRDAGGESAPGYVIAGGHVGYAWPLARTNLRVSLRVDNLFDRQYIGSVIINESNGRYYEPGAGRSFRLHVELGR